MPANAETAADCTAVADAPPLLNLFGLKDSDGLPQLRRRYYEFALLCHPDRGGSADDMVVVQRQYERAKRELQARALSVGRMQQLEDLAQSTVTDEAPVPDMRAIFDEVHGQWGMDPREADEGGSHYEDEGQGEGGGEGQGEGEEGAQTGRHDVMPMHAAAGYGSGMLESEFWRLHGATEPPTYSPVASPSTANGSPKPLCEQPPPRSTAIVEAVAAGSTAFGRALDGPPTRATGFGLHTDTPDQLPLTDYAAAHEGQQPAVAAHEAEERAAAHRARVQADVASRAQTYASEAEVRTRVPADAASRAPSYTPAEAPTDSVCITEDSTGS
jgi:hypothetical protein